MHSVSFVLSADFESTSARRHQHRLTSLCDTTNVPSQPIHAFELDSALRLLTGEHCVDVASRRPSGTFDLNSALRPLVEEHCVNSASRRPSGTLDLDSALRPLAGEHGVDSASCLPSGTLDLD